MSLLHAEVIRQYDCIIMCASCVDSPTYLVIQQHKLKLAEATGRVPPQKTYDLKHWWGILFLHSILSHLNIWASVGAGALYYAGFWPILIRFLPRCVLANLSCFGPMPEFPAIVLSCFDNVWCRGIVMVLVTWVGLLDSVLLGRISIVS